MSGLVEKFRVERLTESSRGIDHAECRYFVLDPLHDKAARQALLAYADAIVYGEPELAGDLYDWLGGIAAELKAGRP